MAEREQPRAGGVLNQALQRLNHEVLNGLKHGYFECKVTSEIITNSKRRVTIKAGMSYQFTVSEDELRD